jgi:sigma-E factor negative regulatory protein RseC
MEEEGVVVKDKAGRVTIKARRSTSCESCASKGTCSAGADTDMLIEADNPVGAGVGDRVVFSVGAASVIKAGLLLYLVPIVSFIFGVVLGQTVAARFWTGWNPDLVSGGLGVVFLVLAYFGLRLYGSYASRHKSFGPRVLRVV